MTDTEIQRATSPRLRDRLHEIREQLTTFPQDRALHLKAEREAIVAELDFRLAEESYEAFVVRQALVAAMGNARGAEVWS